MLKSGIGRTAAIAVMVFVSVSAVGRGQDDGDTERGWQAIEVPVRFPGGTVADYVSVLRKSYETTISETSGGKNRFTVVINQDAQHIAVPEIDIPQIAVGKAIMLLNVVCASHQGVYINEDSADEDGVHASYSVQADRPPELRRMGIFSIAFLQNDEEQTNLLKAIELGLALNESHGVEVKVHSETKLLFVRGNEAELDIARQIVAEMESSR